MEQLGDTSMTRVGDQKAREFLDRRRFSLAVFGASFPHFLLENIPKCRRTEPLANIVHKLDDCRGEGHAVSLGRVDRPDKFFQPETSVTFPERDGAVEKAEKRSGGLVVMGQDQK